MVAGITSAVLAPPVGFEGAIASEPVVWFHYGDTGDDDRGWGCAYRSAQTLLAHAWSGLYGDMQGRWAGWVPSVRTMQQQLVDSGAAPEGLRVGGSQWIGSVEVASLMAAVAGVPCQLWPMRDARPEMREGICARLWTHFHAGAATPCMLGGASGGARAVLGVARKESEDETGASGGGGTADWRLLVLDPHFYHLSLPGAAGPDGKESTLSDHAVRVDTEGSEDSEASMAALRQYCQWQTVEQLVSVDGSYNLCVPQRTSEPTTIPAPALDAAAESCTFEIEIVGEGFQADTVGADSNSNSKSNSNGTIGVVGLAQCSAGQRDGAAALLRQQWPHVQDTLVRGLAESAAEGEALPVHLLAVDGHGDGACVGHIRLSRAQVRLPGGQHTAAVVKSLVVDPTHRRRGIGRALLEGAEAWLRAQLKDTDVFVVLKTSDQQAFYTRCGYTCMPGDAAVSEGSHHADVGGLAAMLAKRAGAASNNTNNAAAATDAEGVWMYRQI